MEDLKAKLQNIIKIKEEEVELLKKINLDILIEALSKLKTQCQDDDIFVALNYIMFLTREEQDQVRIFAKLISKQMSGTKFGIDLKEIFKYVDKDKYYGDTQTLISLIMFISGFTYICNFIIH